jgi:hypothetical protein
MNAPPPTVLELGVLGVGLWAPQWPHWDAARASLAASSASDAATGAPHPARPSTTLLPPAERRRAPFTVLMALAAAEQACTMAGLASSSLLSVFASAHGDLEITDYLCRTLAESPEHLSPTKFHNSVHNAASGYWTIGTGCTQASTALSAWQHNLALGLLEAATQAVCAGQPVLLVAYDMTPTGALACVVGEGNSLSLALVLAPTGPPPASVARIQLSLHATPNQSANGGHDAIDTAGHLDRTGSPWPLLTALAQAQGEALPFGDARAACEACPTLSWPLSPQLGLRLAFAPRSG